MSGASADEDGSYHHVLLLTTEHQQQLTHSKSIVSGLRTVLANHQEAMALAKSLGDVPGSALLVAMCQRGIDNLQNAITVEQDRGKRIQQYTGDAV